MPAELPLAGTRVVDLTMNISGPYCTMILGDLGADIVKIERPAIGDDARHMTPTAANTSAYFLAVNRNKSSVVVDMADAGARERLLALIDRADVFVTNWRPQKLAAYGLDAEAVQARAPHVVYADISAYGTSGRDVPRAGYDMVLQARAGLMSVNGEPGRPPVRVGVSILDMGSGLWLALGVVAALRQRDRTGRAERVSTSLLEVGAAFMAYDVAAYQLTGEVTGKRGSEHPAFAPYGVFQAADGYVALGVGSDALFARLARALDRPEWIDDARFRTNAVRSLHRAELQDAIEACLASGTAAEWASRLAAADVPADIVADVADLFADEQLAGLDAWVEVAGDDRAGNPPVRVPGLPIKLGGTRPPVRLQPPGLGQHDDLLEATPASVEERR